MRIQRGSLLALGAVAALGIVVALGAVAGVGTAETGARRARSVPVVVRDVKTGRDTLGSAIKCPSTRCPDPIQDYVQPDTESEPSIAVNPDNPKNVVTAYQEGRIADGGDATNGFATSFNGGKTWITGQLPKLTTYPGQGGVLERASDAVVAFGPHNLVYANSLVFDFTKNQGLRSGIAVNVSKDGGRSWGPPVLLQDDVIGGLNDKNWIAVDMGKGAGHHFGRVYVVWDRVVPVLYDYCDHNCDHLANWLPDFHTIPGLIFPGQGIGAYPVITKGGGLDVVLDTTLSGVPVPSGTDELEISPGNDELVSLVAPAAGTTPYPAPLAFAPPVDISANQTAGVPAQRAGTLPAAAADPKSGTIYAVWEDSRFRTDGTNDAVISRSSDGGLTWTPPRRVNPGSAQNHVDHYNVTVAVGAGGSVHVAYRQRNQSAKGPLYTPWIDTYYQESTNGGNSFTKPLRVDRVRSNAYYDAFSRDGAFEGDYNQITSAGGYTYVTRAQGQMTHAGERPALTANPDGSDTLLLTPAGKGHQHQRVWVALVQNRRPAPPPPVRRPHRRHHRHHHHPPSRRPKKRARGFTG
ncbi:MAG TPA: sialidase family protein [Solirubrobacteraceae bacterium]|jgi:hypothetical protein